MALAANATPSLAFASSSLLNHNPQFGAAPKRFVSSSSSSSLCLAAGLSSKARAFSFSASAAALDGEELAVEETWKLARPTEVYVCNLPRSCDTEQLLHMFNPHGTVLSAQVYCLFNILLSSVFLFFCLSLVISLFQVCRSAETGESRGSAYVTMASINSARKAIAALDASVSHSHSLLLFRSYLLAAVLSEISVFYDSRILVGVKCGLDFQLR